MSNASRLNGTDTPAQTGGHRTGTGSDSLGGIYDLLDSGRLIDRLRDMIEIPSVNPFDEEPRPGFREQEMAEYYLGTMSAIGLEVGSRDVVPGRPNVWGVLKGKGEGPSLMLAGHLDTVGTENYPDGFKATVEDGRVYGRGACDMKGGLAAYLEVASMIREANIPLKGNLLLVGLADEEHLMIGSQELGENGPWADFGIIGEPSDLVICPAHKGQVGFRIRTHGRAVHSSRPEKGVNAISHMARVVDLIEEYGRELTTRNAHQLCGHARSSPTVIRGGTIVSTIPDTCELQVDRRTLPGETTELVREELQTLLDQLASEVPNMRFDLEGPVIEVAALDVPIDSPIVSSIMHAHEEVMGGEGIISAFLGGTDAPNLGFPAVVCGPGSIVQAHSTYEYVAVDDLVAATKLYLWTAMDLLSV